MLVIEVCELDPSFVYFSVMTRKLNTSFSLSLIVNGILGNPIIVDGENGNPGVLVGVASFLREFRC